MAFFGVTLETIESVWNHPNADRLSLAKMKNLSFQFVIQKDQFKPGDQVLYLPIDSLLSVAVLEKLKLVGKLSGKDKNKVKTMKLRGEISQGIVASVSLFPEVSEFLDNPELITQTLGVTKYEAPDNMTQEGNLVVLPESCSIYDIEGADRNPEIIELLLDQDVVVCEKMEGTNHSTFVNHEGNVFVNQRKNSIIELPGVKNSYWEVARTSGLIMQLQSRRSIAVYSEFCGAGVQKNIYNMPKHSLFIFDIKDNGKWLSYTEYQSLVSQLVNGKNLFQAPVLFTGKLRDYLQGKTIQEMSNGMSLMNPAQLREGIVIKPLTEQYHPKLGRLIIKQRSPEYLSKEND